MPQTLSWIAVIHGAPSRSNQKYLTVKCRLAPSSRTESGFAEPVLVGVPEFAHPFREDPLELRRSSRESIESSIDFQVAKVDRILLAEGDRRSYPSANGLPR